MFLNPSKRKSVINIKVKIHTHMRKMS